MEALGTVPRELRRAILLAVAEGNEEIATAIEYMVRERSVGTLVARMELRGKGVKNPDKVLGMLREAGLIEVKPGCYNLAKPVREWVMHDRERVNHMKQILNELGFLK